MSSRQERIALVDAPGPLDDPVDVLVCGGGMAGLCAAASAVEAGARPLVIEKGAEPGGSMLMSGGTIWTAPTMAIMEAWVPGGDRTRQRRLVDGLAPGLQWLDSLGVVAHDPRSRAIVRPVPRSTRVSSPRA